MSSRSREKIALVVFGGLVVLSLLGLGWYVLAGHSWNVAASNMDDTFGSMDGYTAIVYPGTKKPEVVESAKKFPSSSRLSSGSTDDDSSQTDSEVSGEEPLSSQSDTSVPEGDSGSGASKGIKEPANTNSEIDSAGIKAGTLTKKPVLTTEEAKESYEDKRAVVFELDTVNIEQYCEGIILKKGDHRFGVFSILKPLSHIMLEKQLAYFQRHDVDFIVAITPDKSFAETISGIDIVVCTNDENLFVMGETIDGTFYVDTPEEGRVGAILISPSNVVSAKVIESL